MKTSSKFARDPEEEAMYKKINERDQAFKDEVEAKMMKFEQRS